MKKIHLLLLLILTFVPMACQDNFLEKLPQDSLAPEVFYTNALNLKTGLVGIYDALQPNGMYGNLPQLDGISDNGLLFKFETELINFAKGNANANVSGPMANYYLFAYQLIQRANALLDNINAPGAITQTERDAIQAEATALRAIAYVRLVYLYGEVPLITKFIGKTEALQLTRAPRPTLINFILTELKTAADKLTTRPANNEKGRLTKQAVLGFRARVLLYEARLGKKTWAEARTALAEVLTLAEGAGANLVRPGDGTNGQTNYEAVFTVANADNAEVLFAVKNNELDRAGDLFGLYGVNGGSLSLSVHTNFVADFYATDGLPITNSLIYKATDPYTNRDPRLKATVAVPGELYSTGVALLRFEGQKTKGVLETNFALKKYTTQDGLKANVGQADLILLRLADVLLMVAEAENEVNGPTKEAFAAVNRVRKRVNMPDFPANLTQAQFRDEVQHERRIELGFEGLRWFDLLTLGIADKRINGIGELGRAFVKNKQELFPIPESEINQNKALTQNLGY